MPMISDTQCKSKYMTKHGSLFDQKSMICAGIEEGNPTTCLGDSGGPLVCMENGKLSLVGVTSFVSSKACSLDRPTGFVRVTSFLSWIRSHMEEVTTAATTTTTTTTTKKTTV